MGAAAARLWTANPACFQAIYRTALDAAYLDYCRQYVATEGRRAEELRTWLATTLARPATACQSAEFGEELVRAAYFAHIPLKRLAFRQALIDAAGLALNRYEQPRPGRAQARHTTAPTAATA